VERNTRAEVSLTKQTAQVKERVGPEPKQVNAKPQPKASKPGKGAPPPRVRRIDEPWFPWAKRSYAIFFALIALGELVIGGISYFSLTGTKPPFLIAMLATDAGSLGPVIGVAAAVVAAQVAKFITKEQRALRFMESAVAGIVQYFIWFVLFIGLLYAFGVVAPASSTATPSSSASPLPTGVASPAPTPTASPPATATASPSPAASSTSSEAASLSEPAEIAGLALIDILSFVGAFYIYPPLYKRLRIKPPPPRAPRPAKEPKPADGATSDGSSERPKTTTRRKDDAAARAPTPNDPAPKDPAPKDPAPKDPAPKDPAP
jgi:hypothetical protein